MLVPAIFLSISGFALPINEENVTISAFTGAFAGAGLGLLTGAKFLPMVIGIANPKLAVLAFEAGVGGALLGASVGVAIAERE
jgi:acetyl-CoA carboxylase beta subunit